MDKLRCLIPCAIDQRINKCLCLVQVFSILDHRDITIFSLRGDDYRNFFNHFSPFPLNTESEHVLPNDFKVDIHEIKGLRNYGIMSPAPWSGAYQSFLNSLPPNPPNNT
ncbi:hypothetical protein AtNW77_Chr2g0232431 [Arabidopsis thaliana]